MQNNATSMIDTWADELQSNNLADLSHTGLMYNLFADRLLKSEMVPDDVRLLAIFAGWSRLIFPRFRRLTLRSSRRTLPLVWRPRSASHSMVRRLWRVRVRAPYRSLT